MNALPDDMFLQKIESLNAEIKLLSSKELEGKWKSVWAQWAVDEQLVRLRRWDFEDERSKDMTHYLNIVRGIQNKILYSLDSNDLECEEKQPLRISRRKTIDQSVYKLRKFETMKKFKEQGEELAKLEHNKEE